MLIFGGRPPPRIPEKTGKKTSITISWEPTVCVTGYRQQKKKAQKEKNANATKVGSRKIKAIFVGEHWYGTSKTSQIK